METIGVHTDMQTQTTSTVPVKSLGHLAFAFDGAIEFYEQDGQVYRATVHKSAFDVTGRRYGRWECSIGHFNMNKRFMLGGGVL